MSNKEMAEIVLSWFVGRRRANDAIYQGELIDKNDITNKKSDVSNAVVNEIDTSFIEQYCLGNTYDSILTLATEKKSKSWQSCSECKKMSDVSVLQTRCVFKKNENDSEKWICFNCRDFLCKGKWFYLKILDKLSTLTKCFCL